MLVWRTLKRYKESGNVQNQPGQGRPRSASTSKLIRKSREIVQRNPKRSIWKMAKRVRRNLKRSIKKTAKEANVMDHVYGSRRDLKMSPFKHVKRRPKKQHYRPKLWGNALPKPEILLSCLEAGTLSNLVFSDEKKFDVQHHVNPQNDHVWSCDGEVGP